MPVVGDCVGVVVGWKNEMSGPNKLGVISTFDTIEHIQFHNMKCTSLTDEEEVG